MIYLLGLGSFLEERFLKLPHVPVLNSTLSTVTFRIKITIMGTKKLVPFHFQNSIHNRKTYKLACISFGYLQGVASLQILEGGESPTISAP